MGMSSWLDLALLFIDQVSECECLCLCQKNCQEKWRQPHMFYFVRGDPASATQVTIPAA